MWKYYLLMAWVVFYRAAVVAACALLGWLSFKAWVQLEEAAKIKAEQPPRQCVVQIAWPHKREAVVYVGEWK